MLHAKRTIPITGLMLLAAALAAAGQGAWTSSSPTVAIRAVVADASVGGVVYAASADTVFVSENGGASWTTAASGLQEVTSLLADPGHHSALFAGTEIGVFRSADAGARFVPTGLVSQIRALAVDGSGTELLAAVKDGRPPVMRSTDAGATWTAAYGPHTVGRIAALLIHPEQPNIAYAGLEGDMSYYPMLVARSGDGGSTWTPKFTDWGGPDTTPIAFAVDPITPSRVYAALHGGVDTVAVSRDNGDDWTEVATPGLGASISSIAVDPVSARVWLGTDLGIFYSDTHGADWVPMNDGLTDARVTSLAIEPQGGRIHAGTASGVFDLVVLPPQPPGPCIEDARYLCLLGGRFRVSLTARNPTTGIEGPGTANPEGDRFGFFALPEFTGDPAFPEVLVKMLDETALPGESFWFFYSGLTSLSYVLEVEDMTTGELRTYANTSFDPFCGGADTGLFPVGGGENAASTRKASELPAGTGPSLMLLGGRFEVTLSATDPARNNRTSTGSAIPWNDRAGYFSLPDFTGDPSFPEIFVKMVDFTSISGKFWFFYTGLTHLPYTLTVTDHVTGLVRTYDSAGPFCGAADTSAFAASGIPDLTGTSTGRVAYPEAPDTYWEPCTGDGAVATVSEDPAGALLARISANCLEGAVFNGRIGPDAPILGDLQIRIGDSSYTAVADAVLQGFGSMVVTVGNLKSATDGTIAGFRVFLSR
jgi:hypothetical protein